MHNNSKSNFTFTPRPEAHAMNWADLLSPVRHAVRNLLLRIDGATTQKEIRAGEIAASCFLVYGDRGTGKSTVLLSMIKACSLNTRDDFFKDTEKAYIGKDDNVRRERRMRDEAKASAEKLSTIAWLDVLDLERCHYTPISLRRCLRACEMPLTHPAPKSHPLRPHRFLKSARTAHARSSSS